MYILSVNMLTCIEFNFLNLQINITVQKQYMYYKLKVIYMQEYLLIFW